MEEGQRQAQPLLLHSVGCISQHVASGKLITDPKQIVAQTEALGKHLMKADVKSTFAKWANLRQRCSGRNHV